ncbi:MAG TPA: hypothetical protein VFO16_16655 [Pseudonocardiaceae bacterium]|nr:hypothetical protein [Pseudonocardiaceae bacterium]
MMSEVGHALRAAVLVAMLTGMLAVLNPVPAAAHIIGTGGSPSNYRATVTAIHPAAPAVGVTIGLGGQWVRITNQGAAEIVILGYDGERFLRLSNNHVQANELSGTAVVTGLTRGPAAPGDPAPRWVTVTDGDNATWSDTRISQQAPGSWELPLVVDGQRVTVAGTREEIAPSSPWPWLVVLALLTAGVVALGRRRDWHRPMAAVVAVGMLAFVTHVLGTGFAPQENGRVIGWVGVGAIGAFSLAIGLVTAIAVARRSTAAPDRLVICGAMVLLLAATDINVLWYSQVPFAGPAVLDRALTVLIYASALGMFLAGLRQVRAVRAAQPHQGG